jgi:two-component system, LuxR family, response regulator FixJ
MSAEVIVHVVDDEEAMRASVAFLLGTAGLGSRQYESAAALLACADRLEPGCIVTDIRMPEMNGLELIGELTRREVRHPVIVITGHADVAMAVAAMKAGVVDFLEKPFTDEALLNAVRAALTREQSAASRDRERVAMAARHAQLTAREREVFAAVSAGDSNKEAARRLGISPRTVEIYRANVMAKMQAATLSDLVRMALALG